MTTEIEEKQIVTMGTLKELVPAEIFVAGGIIGIVEKIEAELDKEIADTSTTKGRAAIKSNAYKVAQSKTLLDKMGKELADELNAKLKPINAERRIAKGALEALQIKTRKPLTDWEAEQATIEAERVAREAAEKLAIEIAADEELAGFMDADYDREVQAEAARIEAKRIVDEEEIKRKAAEAATAEAKRLAKSAIDRIEADKQKAIQAEIDATAKAEQAERDKIAAQERAKVEAENAVKARIAAKEQAKRDAQIAAENAKNAEIKRHKLEAARIERERIEREEDIKHASNIMRAAKESIMKCAVIDEETAKKLVIAIKNDNIENVSIQF